MVFIAIESEVVITIFNSAQIDMDWNEIDAQCREYYKSTLYHRYDKMQTQ